MADVAGTTLAGSATGGGVVYVLTRGPSMLPAIIPTFAVRSGALSATLAAPTVAATGYVAPAAVITAALAAPTISMTGTVSLPVSGTIAATFATPTVSMTGTVGRASLYDPRLAWQSVVRAHGTPVGFTGETATLTTGTTYQISAEVKRVLDPTAAVTVYDGATPVTPTAIDYLFGLVTLPSAPAGAVTVDASYIPLVSVAEVREFTIKVATDLVRYDWHDTIDGARRLAGARWASAEFVALADAGVEPGDLVLIEIQAGGATEYFRAWCVVEAVSGDAAVDAVNNTTYSLSSSTRGALAARAFGWGS